MTEEAIGARQREWWGLVLLAHVGPTKKEQLLLSSSLSLHSRIQAYCNGIFQFDMKSQKNICLQKI